MKVSHWAWLAFLFPAALLVMAGVSVVDSGLFCAQSSEIPCTGVGPNVTCPAHATQICAVGLDMSVALFAVGLLATLAAYLFVRSRRYFPLE